MTICDYCGKPLSGWSAGAPRHARCMGKVKPRAKHDATFAVGDVVEYATQLVVGTWSQHRAGTRGTVVRVYPASGRVRVALEDGSETQMSVENVRRVA